nr:MAG TPA: TMPIT-like protein [Caudoviricetes sp.]
MSLWPAVIGALSALCGAFLANKFADQRWEKQISYEKEKEKNKVMREKGEELHSLISRWQKYIGIYQLNQLLVLRGKITETQRQDLQAKEPLESGLHDRLETILFIYFPELGTNLSKIKEFLEIGNSTYLKTMKGNLNDEHAYKEIDACAMKVQETFQSTNAAIRDRLKITL